jgi:hypothetical protein
MTEGGTTAAAISAVGMRSLASRAGETAVIRGIRGIAIVRPARTVRGRRELVRNDRRATDRIQETSGAGQAPGRTEDPIAAPSKATSQKRSKPLRTALWRSSLTDIEVVIEDDLRDSVEVQTQR